MYSGDLNNCAAFEKYLFTNPVYLHVWIKLFPALFFHGEWHAGGGKNTNKKMKYYQKP